jgi:hypothetical protein
MVASDSFAEFLREQLAPLGSMFGKTGVFCDGFMLGMVREDFGLAFFVLEHCLATLEGIMTKLKIAAVAALAMMNTAAYSQTAVDRWIALCSKRASESELASCRSYARGVADAVMLMRPELTNTCIPAGITEKDLVDLILPYVQGVPATSPPHAAATLLFNAFRAAFPCPRR